MANYAMFIDTSNYNFAVVITKDNQVIYDQQESKTLKLADIFSDKITAILKELKLTIRDFTKFYVLVGPGSYIGVRIAITFVKTLAIINNKVQVYTKDSLAFQGATDTKVVSILDARGGKIYVGIYNDGEVVIANQVIPTEMQKDFLESFSDYKVITDYNGLNFATEFTKQKKSFTLVKNIETLEPTYIKSFI